MPARCRAANVHASLAELMAASLQRTIDVLSKSRNEAASPALVAAFAASEGPVFEGIASALATRRSKTGHTALLQRWHELSATQKRIAEKNRSRMGAALRDALLSENEQLFANAHEVAEATGDLELVPTLIMVAEQAHSPRAPIAMKLAMRLVDQLCQMLEDAKARQSAGDQQDLETARRCVLESLERSVERFRQHNRAELIEAFAVLAGPHSGTLRSIMEAPHHPCFHSVIHTLTVSVSPAVLQILTTFLTSKEAPVVVRNVLSKRTDRPFIDALLATPLDPANQFLRRNLARIKSFNCVEAADFIGTQLTAAQQAAAMQLVLASGAPDDYKLDLAQTLISEGQLAGRLAACRALETIPGQRSNALVLAALKDVEGEVQAAAVRQLRDRHIPGTMTTLIDLIDSPHEVVAAAAREALSDFSFDNYLTQFDRLEEEARRTFGARVARIDRQAVIRLNEELASSGRRQRLRAVAMAEAMGMAPLVADALVGRLSDEDHVVRTAAAEALQHCTAADVRDALLAAIGDRSTAVQNAARSSLRAMGVETAGSMAADGGSQ